MRNGVGTYTYANGDTYEGEWSNNLRHGQGTYTYADSGVKVRYTLQFCSQAAPSPLPPFPPSESLGMGLKIGEGLD